MCEQHKCDALFEKTHENEAAILKRSRASMQKSFGYFFQKRTLAFFHLLAA